MQHSDKKSLSPALKVFDVAAACRSRGIDEREIRKLLRLVGRYASRPEIELNLKKRPPRFR